MVAIRSDQASAVENLDECKASFTALGMDHTGTNLQSDFARSAMEFILRVKSVSLDTDALFEADAWDALVVAPQSKTVPASANEPMEETEQAESEETTDDEPEDTEESEED